MCIHYIHLMSPFDHVRLLKLGIISVYMSCTHIKKSNDMTFNKAFASLYSALGQVKHLQHLEYFML